MGSGLRVLGKLLRLVGISSPEDTIRKETPGPSWKKQIKPGEGHPGAPNKSK